VPDTASIAAALTREATADAAASAVTDLAPQDRAAVYAGLRTASAGESGGLRRAVLAVSNALHRRELPIDEFAVALLNAHLPEESVRVIDLVTEGRPTSARTLNTRAVALLMQGRLDEATLSFEEAIQRDPSYDAPLANLANAYVTAGRLAQAETIFARLLSTSRVRPIVLANLARLRLLQRRFEDALESCRAALSIDDRCVEAHVNACCAYYEKGEITASIASGSRATAAGPVSAEAWFFLGRSLVANGEEQRAITCFEEAVRLRGEYLEASYALAVLGKCDHPPREMPRPLVQKLFDEYSEYYDQHLREALKYAVPERLAQLFHRVRTPAAAGLDIVDLGCGTGLTGLAFRPGSRTLVGVDVSPGMLRASAARGIYAQLHLADIAEYLTSADSAFDLAIAGDAVAYVGNLERLFAGARHALRISGWLLLSAEECAGDGYLLSRTGRFQHSRAYLAGLASRSGFGEVVIEGATGRTESDAPVPCLFVAARLLEK
jgi:predicted TPR repeat methyltransferase